jgi:DNA polymerase III gamma/tau subunit
MAFKDFQPPEQGVQLLQRSLARGRLAHAYLFTGPQLEELETLARTLAKTVNCQHQTFSATDDSVTDCCDACHRAGKLRPKTTAISIGCDRNRIAGQLPLIKSVN